MITSSETSRIIRLICIRIPLKAVIAIIVIMIMIIAKIFVLKNHNFNCCR